MSAAVELLLSALYAPILMLTQSTHVFEVLLGRDSGWGAQRRAVSDSTWGDAWHSYRKHTMIGIITAIIAWFLSPSLFAWMSPALAGLLLSVPLSRASGSATLGRLLALLGILRTPEEAHPPRLVARKHELIQQAEALPEDGLQYLARNRDARLAHIQSNVARPSDPRGKPDPNVLTAEQKINDAVNLDELLQWLTREERVHVAGSAAMLHQMAGLPELSKPPPI